MTKKQIIYRVDPKSDEYKWYKKQKNKQKSLDTLIDLAIQQFGITDINKMLIVKTDYQLVGSKDSSRENDRFRISKEPLAKGATLPISDTDETVIKEDINSQPKTMVEKTVVKSDKKIKDSGNHNFGIPGLS